MVFSNQIPHERNIHAFLRLSFRQRGFSLSLCLRSLLLSFPTNQICVRLDIRGHIIGDRIVKST